jgi:putative phosphoribosyl transferase
VIVVRKLGVPYQPELAMGAVGEDGVLVIDERTLRHTGIGADQLEAAARRETTEVQRRATRFRGERPRADVTGRTVLIVDDGIATGSTATAACRVARAHGASYVVLAVPVAPRGWDSDLREEADELIALETPRHFLAVGQWYDDFSQTSDEEVAALLEKAQSWDDPPGPGSDEEVHVGGLQLPGRLTVPSGTTGLVVFAHGSGSSRHSPRNLYVATQLNRAGLGTLLFDLLRPDEESHRAAVFDIPVLADRLADATRWVAGQPATRQLALGYFGASTGAAAALCAATAPDLAVRAIVSRGGRPDLAGPCLDAVGAPTLLIVGGRDPAVHELNRQAQVRLHGTSQLVVVPGATHLFEEPGTLEAVADLAAQWFVRHLAPETPGGGRSPSAA